MTRDPTLLIYQEEKDFITKSTLRYPDIETGGDLFGLWRNEREVVVQIVSGPGRGCRRTATAFFQDKTYLENVGNHLVNEKGLCNIGEWHSHHRLNLPEPSHGDRGTVWRNMPGLGLKQFLLIIATIPSKEVVHINGFIFTAPVKQHQSGEMIRLRTRVLGGPNPFRRQPDVLAKLSEGAEVANFSTRVPPQNSISGDVSLTFEGEPGGGEKEKSKKQKRSKKEKGSEKQSRRRSFFKRKKKKGKYSEIRTDGGERSTNIQPHEFYTQNRNPDQTFANESSKSPLINESSRQKSTYI